MASEAQEAIVAGINSQTDYYGILGIEKEATEDEIRKAYRRQAFKVHPDKNKSEGAETAFKAIGAAYACLIDPERRKRYDTLGHDEENPDTIPEQHFSHFDFVLLSEQLFSAMFGPDAKEAMPSPEQPPDDEWGPAFGLYAFLTLVPIAALLVAASLVAVDLPPAAFHEVDGFGVPVVSRTVKARYYVQSEGDRDELINVQPDLRDDIEVFVEARHMRGLAAACDGNSPEACERLKEARARMAGAAAERAGEPVSD